MCRKNLSSYNNLMVKLGKIIVTRRWARILLRRGSLPKVPGFFNVSVITTHPLHGLASSRCPGREMCSQSTNCSQKSEISPIDGRLLILNAIYSLIDECPWQKLDWVDYGALIQLYVRHECACCSVTNWRRSHFSNFFRKARDLSVVAPE